MRKHSPRKWLHAILDLLPLVIIPIFAIYSHRHTIDSYEVTREKYQVVDFNQQNNSNVILDGEYNNGYAPMNNGNVITFKENHKYIIRPYPIYTFASGSNLYINTPYMAFTTTTDTLFTYEHETTTNYIWMYITEGTFNDFEYSANLFDLTQMFGEGNEPTISEFNQMFPNDYYDYTTSKKVLIQNGTETLNNTDIGSQFVYALYTPIHDYFNLSNVGVFGQLYNWLQLNMFNGTAPISVFIVYHVILYEFIMDLIFLVYCVFMFIIDFTERLIDCLFDKSFGGGR